VTTSSKPPIVITTDFGLKDEYAGVLKGVILSIDADATIIDLTHLIPPHDIRAAARIIGRNHRWFPERSIHLCIVDPGVGSSRRILAIDAAGQFFVGPDNGVFTPIITAPACAAIHQLTNVRWFLDTVSRTFHGRDIMAPAAARLSLGEPLAAAGPRVEIDSCMLLDDPQPVVTAAGIAGVVDSIDRFGNCATTISEAVLRTHATGQRCVVVIKDRIVPMSEQSYAGLTDDTPAALVNSSGYLEISVKNGSAADLLGAAIGTQVRVRI